MNNKPFKNVGSFDFKRFGKSLLLSAGKVGGIYLIFNAVMVVLYYLFVPIVNGYYHIITNELSTLNVIRLGLMVAVAFLTYRNMKKESGKKGGVIDIDDRHIRRRK